jgi:hypothetical protein
MKTEYFTSWGQMIQTLSAKVTQSTCQKDKLLALAHGMDGEK